MEDNYPFWETDIFDQEDFPQMHFIEHHYSGDCTNWWIPNRACVEAMLRSSGFDITGSSRRRSLYLQEAREPLARRLRLVEAIMIWNEPNNKSHWDFEIDPGWQVFAKMVNVGGGLHQAGESEAAVRAGRYLADRPELHQTLEKQDVLNHIDVVAVHGFPLDWNHWTIHEWPDKLR